MLKIALDEGIITREQILSLLPKKRAKGSVWTIATQPYPKSHYATFPEKLVEPCIKAGSKKGDVVLDPFAGTFTVGRVAERLKRKAIGLDLAYQDLATERLRHNQIDLLA